PEECAWVRAGQHGPDDARGIWGPELAVDGARQGLGQELALAESGQRIQIALLFLRRRRGPELPREFVEARGVARMGEHAEDRGEHVGIEVGRRPGVELAGARLNRPIVAAGAERADEIAA